MFICLFYSSLDFGRREWNVRSGLAWLQASISQSHDDASTTTRNKYARMWAQSNRKECNALRFVCLMFFFRIALCVLMNASEEWKWNENINKWKKRKYEENEFNGKCRCTHWQTSYFFHINFILFIHFTRHHREICGAEEQGGMSDWFADGLKQQFSGWVQHALESHCITATHKLFYLPYPSIQHWLNMIWGRMSLMPNWMSRFSRAILPFGLSFSYTHARLKPSSCHDGTTITLTFCRAGHGLIYDRRRSWDSSNLSVWGIDGLAGQEKSSTTNVAVTATNCNSNSTDEIKKLKTYHHRHQQQQHQHHNIISHQARREWKTKKKE